MLSGQLFVISAPSGAGKTSLVAAALQSVQNIAVSVSHTTRSQRAGEVDGRDYHFVDKSTFNGLIQQNVMFEYAEVFGNYYGTSKQNLLAQLAKGVDIILEIDWQGAAQVRKLWPESISIFVLPPSREELRSRLMKRNQDANEIIDVRMSEANQTIKQAPNFDFWIINDDFEVALNELTSIFIANRQKSTLVAAKNSKFLEKLLGHT